MLGSLLGFLPRVKQHERWLLNWGIATHILVFEDDGSQARMLGSLLGFMPRVKQHKRRLLDRIATRILALEDDGSQARARACWGYC